MRQHLASHIHSIYMHVQYSLYNYISSLFFIVIALHPTYILTTIYSGQYLWAIVSSGFITQILIPNSINEHEQDDPWPQLTGSIYSSHIKNWMINVKWFSDFEKLEILHVLRNQLFTSVLLPLRFLNFKFF